MEKRRPTYDLQAIKRVGASRESLAITRTALRSAPFLGFDRAEVVKTIQSIERNMFYKSMNTYADARLWQDVYHVPAGEIILYVKFQADLIAEFQVMSFKEK